MVRKSERTDRSVLTSRLLETSTKCVTITSYVKSASEIIALHNTYSLLLEGCIVVKLLNFKNYVCSSNTSLSFGSVSLVVSLAYAP